MRRNKHSISMIDIPEEFLPPIREERAIGVFLGSLHCYETVFSFQYLVQEATALFFVLKKSNKIQTGVIRSPHVSKGRIHSVLEKSSNIQEQLSSFQQNIFTLTETRAFQFIGILEKMFSFHQHASRIQTTEASRNPTTQQIHSTRK